MKIVSKLAMLIAVALSMLVNLTGVTVAQTVVDTRVVALDTASTDSNLAAVPHGLSVVDSDSTFYVEIWIKNVGPQQVGFFVAIVDVVYTRSLLDVKQVQVDGVFDFAGFSTGTVDQGAGRIDDLGGAVGFSDVGSGQDSWARLAVLEIEAVGAGIATI